MSGKYPVVFIVGPTASGKSDLGMALAKQFKGVILNCDSVQAYQKTDIGTAKPSLESRQEIPHHLVDFLAPPEEMTAGQFREWARDILEQETPWRMVFAVGGSGFYIRALQSRMYTLSDVSSQALQQIYELEQEEGLEGLYKEALRLDPGLKVIPQDSYRLKRALGLMLTHKKSLKQIQEETIGEDWPYSSLKLGIRIDRKVLRQRVEQRTEDMLNRGWIDEVKVLLEQGLQNWAPLRSVGYKEIVSHMKGEMSFEEMRARIVISSMQLAKRQMTWFRKDEEIKWLDFPVSSEQAEAQLKHWLKAQA